MSQPWRKPYPEDKTLEQVLRELPPGTGVSVIQYAPAYEVVAILPGRRVQYVVVDTLGAGPGRKPTKVYGPVRSKKDADTWARQATMLWRAVTGQLVDYT